MGMVGGTKVMDLSSNPLCPFLKNIKIDLYCQLVSLTRLKNILFHELLCSALSHLKHSHLPCTHRHSTHLRPGDRLFSAPTLEVESTKTTYFCSYSLGSPPVCKALPDFQGVRPEASIAWCFESWESSSREGTQKSLTCAVFAYVDRKHFFPSCGFLLKINSFHFFKKHYP